MASDQKVAFVTGATGMSRAAAIELARRGYRVALLSRGREDVEETVAAVEAAGSVGLVLTGDISDEAAVVAAYEKIEADFGRLDAVFANAGINGTWAPLDELTLEEWQETISINLTGTFLTVKHALPLLKKQGGAIVITSSVNGTRMFSNTGASAYATTRAGVFAFAKMIALELAPQRIRVNTICPGAIDTQIEDNTEREHLDRVRYPRTFPEGQIPLTGGKPGRAEDVAKLVAFLLSDDAAHITGTPVWIDGAQSLFVG